MTVKETQAGVASRSWYHSIDLGNGVVTPGHPWGPRLWDNVRKTRSRIDYSGKRVLDIGSFDGMWAFEAERLGASLVVATDCILNGLGNFLFCREALHSNVIPFYNVNSYSLYDHLAVAVEEFGRFDIIQHLGMFYHVQDPMLTLRQSRSVLASGGTLLLETAFVVSDDSIMLFNGTDGTIYEDPTTFWAPSLRCLNEMLNITHFKVGGEINTLMQRERIGRACLCATAINEVEGGYSDFHKQYFKSRNHHGVNL